MHDLIAICAAAAFPAEDRDSSRPHRSFLCEIGYRREVHYHYRALWQATRRSGWCFSVTNRAPALLSWRPCRRAHPARRQAGHVVRKLLVSRWDCAHRIFPLLRNGPVWPHVRRRRRDRSLCSLYRGRNSLNKRADRRHPSAVRRPRSLATCAATVRTVRLVLSGRICRSRFSSAVGCEAEGVEGADVGWGPLSLAFFL